MSLWQDTCVLQPLRFEMGKEIESLVGNRKRRGKC